jgi:hypothetical protein
MFKAKFTKLSLLRRSMIKWQIGYFILVDIVLISISAFGLLQVKIDTQLFMTMVETIMLSILLIIFGLIEMKQRVEQTNQLETKGMNGFDR